MKKQNTANKLAFNKAAVIELNDNVIIDVNGGSTPACVWAAVEGFAISVGVYVALKELAND
jgi:hypothetical protein